jgi:FixJ family two-component response regulator
MRPADLFIAIVDDDDAVRRGVERLIRAMGLKAEAFSSADELLSSGRLADAACLLLDVKMPGKSGFDLQRELRGSGRQVPVVFITAHDDDTTRKQAHELGTVAFVQKPFHEETLAAAVRLALDVTSATGQSPPDDDA